MAPASTTKITAPGDNDWLTDNQVNEVAYSVFSREAASSTAGEAADENVSALRKATIEAIDYYYANARANVAGGAEADATGGLKQAIESWKEIGGNSQSVLFIPVNLTATSDTSSGSHWGMLKITKSPKIGSRGWDYVIEGHNPMTGENYKTQEDAAYNNIKTALGAGESISLADWDYGNQVDGWSCGDRALKWMAEQINATSPPLAALQNAYNSGDMRVAVREIINPSAAALAPASEPPLGPNALPPAGGPQNAANPVPTEKPKPPPLSPRSQPLPASTPNEAPGAKASDAPRQFPNIDHFGFDSALLAVEAQKNARSKKSGQSRAAAFTGPQSTPNLTVPEQQQFHAGPASTPLALGPSSQQRTKGPYSLPFIRALTAKHKAPGSQGGPQSSPGTISASMNPSKLFEMLSLTSQTQTSAAQTPGSTKQEENPLDNIVASVKAFKYSSSAVASGSAATPTAPGTATTNKEEISAAGKVTEASEFEITLANGESGKKAKTVTYVIKDEKGESKNEYRLDQNDPEVLFKTIQIIALYQAQNDDLRTIDLSRLDNKNKITNSDFTPQQQAFIYAKALGLTPVDDKGNEITQESFGTANNLQKTMTNAIEEFAPKEPAPPAALIPS